MLRTSLLGTAAALALTPFAFGQAELSTVLGFSSGADVSTDGTTMALSASAYWTAAGGVVSLSGSNDCVAVDADGNAFAGELSVQPKNTAGQWKAGMWNDCGALAGSAGCDANFSNPYDISGAGDIVVGLGWDGCAGRAFRWDEATGVMTALPQNFFDSARANAVSPDGSTVGGWEQGLTGARIPTRWNPDGSGGFIAETLSTTGGEVYDLSNDGSIAVGELGGLAAIWRPGQPVLQLPELPTVMDQHFALGVDDDGTTVVGTAGTFFFSVPEAFYYREDVGMTNLTELANELGAGIPGGERLSGASAVSGDGRTIVGTYASPASIFGDAFHLVLPDAWLRTDVDSISLSAGGSQVMTINGGPDQGGNFYLLLGTAAGTTPGVLTPAGTLPLNIDAYFNLLLNQPNGVVSNSFGTLDSLGRATATLNVPAGTNPGLVGATLNHAYLVLSVSGSLVVEKVSNPQAVALTS